MGDFKDFIPDGEPTGAQGSGFRDFVPDPEPVFHEDVVVPETAPVVEETVVEPKFKKKVK